MEPASSSHYSSASYNNFSESGQEKEKFTEISTPTLKRKRYDYEEIGSFGSEADFLAWLAQQNTWTKKKTNKTPFSIKQYFYCRHILNRRLGASCQSLLQAKLNKQTGQVTVKQKGGHEGHAIDTQISAQVKEIIREKMHQRLMPAQICDTLAEAYNETPILSQVQNLVQYERKKSGVTAKMTLAEMNLFCHANSSEPDDPNAAYVIGYNTSSENEICVVWSTKYLMQLQKNSSNICVDATYKLLSIGWPVLRSGFYDANSHFHPTAIRLNSHRRFCSPHENVAVQKKYSEEPLSERNNEEAKF